AWSRARNPAKRRHRTPSACEGPSESHTSEGPQPKANYPHGRTWYRTHVDHAKNTLVHPPVFSPWLQSWLHNCSWICHIGTTRSNRTTTTHNDEIVLRFGSGGSSLKTSMASPHQQGNKQDNHCTFHQKRRKTKVINGTSVDTTAVRSSTLSLARVGA
ncbi:unnamed protein product, partial [Ectocarpus sp. 4 AP-2014]